jgi:hypothetical protein
MYLYETGRADDMPVEPASRSRDWMDNSNEGFAHRCLPLAIANQAGWVVANPITFDVLWNGGRRLEDLLIIFDGPSADDRVRSHFGHGILTFTIPYLFRTPENVNLWVKGPTNVIKDGIQALEGIVETDWSPASFTMNWKVTRAGQVVRFTKGEPICMVVPTPRGLAEALEPRQQPIAAAPEEEDAHRQWQASRLAHNEGLLTRGSLAWQRKWERHYFRGVCVDGTPAPAHQTRLRLHDVIQDDRSLSRTAG